MSKKIKVILLEDVAGLGQAGDITLASEGYARNFLFVQGKAALADEQTQAAAASQKQRQQKAETENLVAAQKLAAALENTELIIRAKVNDEQGEEIYGSISAQQIALALKEQAGFDIKAKDISLAEKITSLDTYDVAVKLAANLEANIKVTVVSDAA